MAKDRLDIRGLDKAEVLAALYNSAKPLGMGWLHFDPTPMTVAEAQEVINAGGNAAGDYPAWPSRNKMYFDYFKGRVMKVDISGDELYTGLYDRDNGEGAAERALSSLRVFA